MTPGEDDALTTCLGAMGMYMGVRCCVFCFACVCVKFSVFQNFNKGVKFFSIIDLVLFVRLHFQLL